MCGNEKHQLKTIVINTRDNKEIELNSYVAREGIDII